MRRLFAVKALLWFVLGGAAVLAVARFVRGLGATTALDDVTPWGFWIGFDVMGGVALAAGGFVVAAAVNVFRLERYRGLVRPAVLTAFLGYLAVVGGLLLDLGRPWRIWHLIVYWNPRSPLFEVGWCVMLYTAVLALEFAPVLVEAARHPLLARVHGWLKHATAPLVILGIMLSTLHQSSLGSLFLIMPQRLHPLWYTPWLPVLFFVSAVGLGLLVVTAESLVSATLYEQEPELDVLQGLARAGAWVLGGYAGLRIGDALVRGQGPAILAGTLESWLWLAELLLSAIVPATLLAIPRVRRSRAGLGAAALMGVVGLVLNRLDVGGLAQVGPTGSRYFPSWTEVWMSMGVVAAAALTYLFVAERFRLLRAGALDRERFRNAAPAFDRFTLTALPEPYRGGVTRQSLALILGAALAFALLPERALSGSQGVAHPVPPRGYADRIALDGTRASPIPVLFDHQAHVRREGGEASCAGCHHLLVPGERATGCARCHRDLYLSRSVFDHAAHQVRLGEGRGCVACHREPEGADGMRTRPCLECHTRMLPAAATIRLREPGRIGPAPGYVPALHALCIGCHEKRAEDAGLARPELARCATCHAGAIAPFDPTHPDEVRRL